MKTLIIFIIILFPVIGYAQIPDYFGQDQKWTGGSWQSFATNFAEENEEWTYFVVGDTLIGGNTYHKIYKNGWFTEEWGSQLVDAYSYDTTLAFFLRQQGQKIYYFDFGHQKDSLWVDYGVQVGDTIKGKMARSFTAIVDSVDTLILYDEPHCRIFLNQFNGGVGNAPQLIEGIGYFNDNTTKSGAFEELSPDGYGFSSKLMCYAKNDSTVYSRIFQSCTFNSYIEGLSIEEKDLIDIQLFPNPSTGKVNIQSSEPIEKVIIYSMNGQRIMEFSLKSKNEGVINVSEVQSGIYICKVITKNGKNRNIKLVVE